MASKRRVLSWLVLTPVLWAIIYLHALIFMIIHTWHVVLALCSLVPYWHVLLLWYPLSCLFLYLACISMNLIVVPNFHGYMSLILSSWACAVVYMIYLAHVDFCLVYPHVHLISMLAFFIHDLFLKCFMLTWLLCLAVDCGCMSLAIAFTSLLYFRLYIWWVICYVLVCLLLCLVVD